MSHKGIEPKFVCGVMAEHERPSINYDGESSSRGVKSRVGLASQGRMNIVKIFIPVRRYDDFAVNLTL